MKSNYMIFMLGYHLEQSALLQMADNKIFIRQEKKEIKEMFHK